MDDTALLNVGLALVDAYEAQDVLAIGKVWLYAEQDVQEPDTVTSLRSQDHSTPKHRSREEMRAEYAAQERWWKARKQGIAVAEFKLSLDIALRNR